MSDSKRLPSAINYLRLGLWLSNPTSKNRMVDQCWRFLQQLFSSYFTFHHNQAFLTDFPRLPIDLLIPSSGLSSLANPRRIIHSLYF